MPGADALLVVYNPLMAVEEPLKKIALSVASYAAYNPLSTASISIKPDRYSVAHLSRILQPCYHLDIDVEDPPPDKQLKVGAVLLCSIDCVAAKYILFLVCSLKIARRTLFGVSGIQPAEEVVTETAAYYQFVGTGKPFYRQQGFTDSVS